MSDLDQLGANIRSLRKAYGETLEQLGEAIHVEKNTVSQYEHGKREPDKAILSAIAKHFMVSVEELLRCDLTGIGKIIINIDYFWKNIDNILPIVSTEEALKNEDFKKGFGIHRAFYDQLCALNFDGFDDFIDNTDNMFIYYLSAGKVDEIRPEASANFVALWFFFMLSLQLTPRALMDQSAALIQVAKKDEKAKKILQNPDSFFEDDAEEALRMLNDDSMVEMISEMMIIIKNSQRRSDLADYFLALRYLWGFVDNRLEFGFSQRIGIEMMRSFASVKNKYATWLISSNSFP